MKRGGLGFIVVRKKKMKAEVLIENTGLRYCACCTAPWRSDVDVVFGLASYLRHCAKFHAHAPLRNDPRDLCHDAKFLRHGAES
jgi:hypothetical protein